MGSDSYYGDALDGAKSGLPSEALVGYSDTRFLNFALTVGREDRLSLQPKVFARHL